MSIEKELLDGIAELREAYENGIKTVHARIDEVQLKSGRGFGGDTGRGESMAEAICRAFKAGQADFERYRTLSFEVPSVTKANAITTTSNTISHDVAGPIWAGDKTRYRVRLLFPNIETTEGAVLALRESAFTSNAAVQTEGSAKGESEITLAGATLPLLTVAHWVSVSVQAMEDVPGVQEYLRRALVLRLEEKIEDTLLNQASVGFFAAATNATTNTANYSSRYDQMAQLFDEHANAGFEPNAVLMNRATLTSILSIKETTNYNSYVAGDPRMGPTQSLWGVPVVITPKLATNNVLIVDASCGMIRYKGRARVQISDSHSDFFVKNLLAVRCEERITPVCGQPKGFRKATLT